MTSAAQIEANRANAQHSTGPKTPEGKKASSSNATRQGLTSTKLVVRPEDEEYFIYFLNKLFREFSPASEFQNHLFDQILHASWNIQRCTVLEADLQNEAIEAGLPDAMFDDQLNAKLERIYRYKKMHETTRRRTVAELRSVQIDAEVQKAAAQVAVPTRFEIETGVRIVRRHVPPQPSRSEQMRNAAAILEQIIEPPTGRTSQPLPPEASIPASHQQAA